MSKNIHRPKKLKPNAIHKIRKMYASGKHTQSKLAKKFKVSQSLVSKIVNYYIHKSDTDFQVGGEADVKVGVKYGN